MKNKMFVYDCVNFTFHVFEGCPVDRREIRRFLLQRLGTGHPKRICRLGRPFKIASVTITGKCNMNCPYCFVQPVDKVQDMDPELAGQLLELMIPHMEEYPFQIYLWGGEPTQNPEGLVAFIESTQRFSHRCELLLTTNGCMDRVLLEKLCSYRNLVFQISLDGPPPVQSEQKKLISGEDSYRTVLETIRYLNEKKARVIIRYTVTSRNLSYIGDVFRFLTRNRLTSRICIEPIHTYVGRSTALKHLKPDADEYVKQLFEALPMLEENNIGLYTQPLRAISQGKSYDWGYLSILPDGNTVCTNAVIDKSHKDFGTFNIGRADEERKRLVFDEKNIGKLEENFLGNTVRICSRCPVYTFCAGNEQRDLLCSVPHLGIFDNYRCLVFIKTVERWMNTAAEQIHAKSEELMKQGRYIPGKMTDWKWDNTGKLSSISRGLSIIWE